MMMKRLFAIALVCVAFILSAVQLSAQKVGVVGGATFSSMQNVENSARTGWNLGVTSQFKLPLGFSIQPALIYNAKAAQIDAELAQVGIDVNYLEIPVSVQWGPDLLIFRPYLEATPYIGYALAGKGVVNTALTKTEWGVDDLQRFAYGIGLGGGIEIWRFQVNCRYNWNLGPLFNGDGTMVDLPNREEAFVNENFGGVTLSFAFFFGK